MIRFLVTGAFAITFAGPAAAQAIEWSSTAKIANGSCGDGAIARMTETVSSINVKILLNGKVTVDFNMPLAADGSAKGDYRGVMGRQVATLAAGRGKRLMTTGQVEGNWQWRWMPD